MGMVTILFNGAKPFKKLLIPFRQMPKVKSGENCSRSFREEDTKNLHNFIHVYSPGARVDNPQETKLWLNLKSYIVLIIHCKFQPIVFNTF